ADQAGVAAVHRIAEHAFDGVLTQQPEEHRGLDGAQPLALLVRRQIDEAGELTNAFAIDLARGLFALIAVLWHGLNEGRLCKAILVASVGTGKLAIDID